MGRRNFVAVINAFIMLGRRGGDEAIDTICACIEDYQTDIREAAVASLPHVAGRGNEYAINRISKLLLHWNTGVVLSAMHAFVHLVDKCDRRGIAAVIDCLRHSEDEVRRDAVRVMLLEFVDKGDTAAIEEISC